MIYFNDRMWFVYVRFEGCWSIKNFTFQFTRDFCKKARQIHLQFHVYQKIIDLNFVFPIGFFLMFHVFWHHVWTKIFFWVIFFLRFFLHNLKKIFIWFLFVSQVRCFIEFLLPFRRVCNLFCYPGFKTLLKPLGNIYHKLS